MDADPKVGTIQRAAGRRMKEGKVASNASRESTKAEKLITMSKPFIPS